MEPAVEPKLTMVLAISQDGVIGDKGKLPWCIPEDMKHFRSITMGHAIIMGRKTHESIGKALPGRRNIVISTTQSFYPGCEIVSTPDEAIQLAMRTDHEPMVIGGAQIYNLLLPRAHRLWLTEVHNTYPNADTHFYYERNEWRELSRTSTPTADYVCMERMK